MRVDSRGDDTRERERWAVDAGHEKAAENDFVEGGVGAAWNIRYYVSDM